MPGFDWRIPEGISDFEFEEMEGFFRDTVSMIHEARREAQTAAADIKARSEEARSSTEGSKRAGLEDWVRARWEEQRGGVLTDRAALGRQIAGSGIGGGGGRDILGRIVAGAGGGIEGTAGIWGLWRARAIQTQAQQLGRLGQRIVDATEQWALYADQAERSDSMMRGLAATHGESAEAVQAVEKVMTSSGMSVTEARSELAEYMRVGIDLSSVMPRVAASLEGGAGSLAAAMKRQQNQSQALREELGSGLVPIYTDLANIQGDVAAKFSEADDTAKGVVSTGMAMVGVFTTVSMKVIEGVSAFAALIILMNSFQPIANISAAQALKFAGSLGLIAASVAGVATAYSSFNQRVTEGKDRVHDAGLEAGRSFEYMGWAIEQAYEEAPNLAKWVVELTGGVEEYKESIRGTAEEWDAALAAAERYSAAYAMTEDAMQSMSAIASLMQPQAAAIFGDIARIQEQYHAEMLTDQRRYEFLMAEMEEEGWSERRDREAQALVERMALNEDAHRAQMESARRALGAVVIEYIQHWAEVTGEIEVARQAIGQAGIEFGMWEPEQWKEAEWFMLEELGRAGIGRVPWSEGIAGAGQVAAEAINVMGNVVTIEGPVSFDGPVLLEGPILLEESVPGLAADGLDIGKLVRDGEELRSMGVRTR